MPRSTPGSSALMAGLRRAIASAALIGLLLGLPGPLRAHAELVSADPIPNASIVDGPDRISITFSEPIDPENASVVLLDARTQTIEGVGPVRVDAEGTRARVDVPSLEPGVYTVSYQVVSTVDGHATRGLYSFVVDPTGAEAPPTSPPTSSSPAVDAWAVASRWLALLAGLVGLGTLVTWWHAARATLEASAPGADPGPPWGLVMGSAAVTVAGLVLYLMLSARPLTPPGAVPGGVPFDVAAPFGWTPFAIAMRVAVLAALAAGALAVLGRWRPYGFLPVLGAASFGVSLAGMSAAGHASSLGGPVNVALDWLHLVAAAAWLGGIPAIVVLAARAAGPGQSRRGATIAMLRRHGPMALVAGPLVVLTGLANSPLVLGSSRELVASGYGNLLLAKGALASVALGIGAANHLALRGRGRGSVAALVGIELVVAAIAVMAAATMVTIQPSAARQPVPAAPSVHPAHFFGEAGPSSIHASVSLPSPGEQSYQVTVRDAEGGAPRHDIQKVFLTFTPPANSGLPSERVELDAGPIHGLYAITGAYTPVIGDWTLEVTVRRSGARDESVSFGMDVLDSSKPFAGEPPDTGVGVPPPLGMLWGILPSGVVGWVPGAMALAAFALTGRRRSPPLLRGVLLAAGVILVLGAGSRSVVEAANRPGAEELAAYEIQAAGSLADGERIYLANCASCHGADGAGEGPIRPLPAPRPLQDALAGMSGAEVSYRIANGLAGTPMPAFGDSLTEQERRDLVGYLLDRWGAP